MDQTVAIVGDGQMGLVLADALVTRGASVRLWGPFPDDIAALGSTRTAPRRLPDFTLPDEVELTAVDESALRDADFIVNAIPTQFVRAVWQRIGGGAGATTPVLSVSKGIENGTLLAPTQIIADVLSEREGRRAMAALSGPTVAAELARRQPATLVAASDDDALAASAQDLFNVRWLRIYRHRDLLGVELAGATKNVIALAAGMVDGLEAGDNAKSALLARGLAEIARLGLAMGAQRDTFFGVAGVGDLATTCFSPCGRNRTCGERLGRGESLDAILSSTASVVEGVATTRSVMELARRHGVEMPITAAVHAILFEGLNPADAIRELMQRKQKAEQIG
jgi:glycerol-3-phosphate dehydrogenase (NAD(P)+)